MSIMTNTNVKPTELNIWCLKQLFAGCTEVPNRIDKPSAPHLRRCIKGGLLVVDGKVLRLTEAGIAAVK